MLGEQEEWTDPQTLMDREWQQLGDHDVHKRIQAIAQNETITNVELNNCQLRGDRLQALLDALRGKTTVQSIKLSYNDLGPDGMEVLAPALSQLKSLTSLEVANDDIHDAGVTHITSALMKLPGLTRLSLDGAGLSDAGLETLAAALPYLPALTHLSLTKNIFGDRGATALAHAVKQLPSLCVLRLRNNKVAQQGAAALAETLRTSKSLNTLDLSFNRVNDVGVSKVLRVVPYLPSLQDLRLYDNGVSEEGLLNALRPLQRQHYTTTAAIRLFEPALASSEAIARTLATLRAINKAIKFRFARDGPLDHFDDHARGAYQKQCDLLELLKMGSVPLKTAKVFVCGDYGIGKTTMIRSLPGKTGYIQHLIYHVMQPANEPDRAEERTPGIKVCDMVIRDRGSGEADEVASLRVYDFGGQLAYHVIHTLMMSDRLAAFVVCVDLSQREQHVKERANYWLQFICTRLQQGMAAAANSIGAAPMTEVKPRVIIVGTKKDLAYKNNLVDADGHPTWGKAMMADLQDTFGHIIDIHSTLIRFTCFLDKGRNFNALRLELVRHWRWLKDRQLEVPKVVSEVAAILKTAQLECPLWKVGDLLERVHKSSEHEFAVTAALPENIFHLTLRYLHARGDLLWYYKLPSLADVVFLSPNWLLHDVMGKALQPKGVACGGLRPKRGVVSFSDISAAFEGIASPELVISILQHALLCFELPQNERGRRRFMLPSRVEEDVDVDKEWRQHEDDDDHDNWAVYGGRRLKVTDDALALPPGFFPHVQTRLHSKFRTPPDIWRNAFRCEWRGVQCFGLQRGDREVDVWVRAREGATTHALPCLTKVFSLLQEEARGIDSHHIVLSPKQLRQHVPKPIGYAFDAIHNQPPNEFVESSYHDPGQSALSERVYDLLMLPPERPDSAMPTWQCPGYEWHHPSWRLDDTLDEQLRWSGPNAHRTYTAPLPPNTQLYEWVEKQMAPGMSLSRVEVTKSATMLQLFNGRLAQCASRRASPNSPHFNRTFDYDRDKKRMVEQLKAQFAQTGEDVEHVNVLIAWHGCSVSNIDAMASEGLANLSKPADRGFYGAGIYVTPQAGYAAGYSTRLLPGTWEAPNSRGEHVLLLCAVSIGLAQPITRQADYNEASRCKWFGEPIKDGFDARYVQVLSSDNFQATPTPGTYNFEEIVVSQEAQVLPIAKVFVKVNRDELRDYLASPPPAPAPAP